MSEKLSVIRYDSKAYMEMRITGLDMFGHESSVWDTKVLPPKRGHVVEIISPDYVSRQCWEEIYEKCNHVTTVTLCFRKLVERVFIDSKTKKPIRFVEYGDEIEKIPVYQFFFSDPSIAKKMALSVQKSARNVRKNKTRQARIEEAGGFHNKKVIEQLFKIQNGRCYYSGYPLTKQPKNYVIDHIDPICQGGTNWPVNLALVIKEINTWKGGHASSEETLIWLGKKRGKSWLRTQKLFCLEVDKSRQLLDLKFRKRHKLI